MLKHSLAAGLLACAALTPAALAQDAKQPQQQQQQQSSAQSGSIDFIQQIENEQFRSTNLVGETVYNEQDENIGDISDLILDRSGQVAGVIIGVGGFLGIGESEVAVPMDALRFVPDNQAMAAGESGERGTDAAATGRAAATDAEKQPGSAGQPSGTSTQAALPNQNAPDQGSAQTNAVEGTGQAKQDPAQSGSAATGNMAPQSGSAASGSGSAQSGSAASGDVSAQSGSAGAQDSGASGTAEGGANEDWLSNMRVVLNTTREDLTDAPKLGDNN